MTRIQISQLTKDMAEAVPIGEYGLLDSWERLERIFASEVKNPLPERPFQVWIEEKDEGGDLTDRCFAIEPHHAVWFLREFLRDQPEWRSVQTAVSEEAS